MVIVVVISAFSINTIQMRFQASDMTIFKCALQAIAMTISKSV